MKRKRPIFENRRTQGIGFLTLLIVFGCCWAGPAAGQQRASEHFEIFHEAGFAAVSAGYSRLVEQGLESAYNAFLAEGFAIFPGTIRVDILETADGDLGAEYLAANEDGNSVPVIEIATQSIMEEYLSYAYVDTTLEDVVASTCAHELFHVIQDYHSLQGTGDISEQSFVEAQATAIQEFVVPTANDYLDPALDFLLAPDSMAFFQRSYDAGIFWVYALDQFGVQFLLNLMNSSALYDGRYAIDHALEPLGLTFFDVWANFAVSLATGTLPDADVIATLVPQAEGSGWWTRTRDPAAIPPVVFRETWTGKTIDAIAVNETNTSEYVPFFEDDGIGTRLRVAHAYGIDILEIAIADVTPMSIQFRGDAETQFRITVASESNAAWSSMPFETSITLQPNASMTRLRVVVTRSEAGTGEYTLSIRTQ